MASKGAVGLRRRRWCLWAWISVASTATRRAIGWHGLGADPADGVVLLILRRSGIAALIAKMMQVATQHSPPGRGRTAAKGTLP